MRHWNKLGNGYYTLAVGRYNLVLHKASPWQWYGGAAEGVESSVPLYGPFRLRSTAIRQAKDVLTRLVVAVLKGEQNA